MLFKSRLFERLVPVAMGGATLLALFIWRADIAYFFAPNGLNKNPNNLYGAVFQWASIQSGFVFGIYGFIATKRGGFVGAFAKGQSFDDFLGYARRAYLGGFALTFASLPIMVAAPDISDPTSWAFRLVAVWFAGFVWTFCAFLRVAFIFGLVAATPDRKVEIIG